MDYPTFIGRVCAQQSLADNGHAERAARAVIGALAERLPAPLAKRLCAHLPPEFRPVMMEAPSHPTGDETAFLERVAAREGRSCDRMRVHGHVGAVMATVCEVLPPADAQEAAGYLPTGLTGLLDRSLSHPVADSRRVRRVA